MAEFVREEIARWAHFYEIAGLVDGKVVSDLLNLCLAEIDRLSAINTRLTEALQTIKPLFDKDYYYGHPTARKGISIIEDALPSAIDALNRGKEQEQT